MNTVQFVVQLHYAQNYNEEIIIRTFLKYEYHALFILNREDKWQR